MASRQTPQAQQTLPIRRNGPRWLTNAHLPDKDLVSHVELLVVCHPQNALHLVYKGWGFQFGLKQRSTPFTRRTIARGAAAPLPTQMQAALGPGAHEVRQPPTEEVPELIASRSDLLSLRAARKR